ncbi:WD40/YVTN/BNR-like repeat-containing protein [Paenibacillus flagellatus]|uniref:Photosynthesis system II assembly factor Ycf48/Hcf136-like domain-containing protein n=1 Tax=Paenibacillus flagellatus TaxID=2211139 RepID=A0A2V5K0D1_9BACL|nr:hypothetical protein [Paenibacillus flagellatus]PYI52639.1 hypothetical protein DLM86_20965 [Paenibacillus flagellatus]
MKRFRVVWLASVIVLLAISILTGCAAPETSADPGGGGAAETPPPTAADPKPGSSDATKPDPGVKPPASGEAGSGSHPTAPANVRMGKVTAVRLADPQSGWVGGEGWIARTDDGGKSWKAQYGGAGTVAQLFALNGREAWAAQTGTGSAPSGGRVLLATTDGGEHWAPAGMVPNEGFLHFVSKEEAFSANARTTDGGKTWTTMPIPPHTVGDVYFHDKDNGWAATQEKDTIAVKRTTDGGQSWQTVMTRRTVAPATGAVIRSAGVNDAWVEWIGDSGMTQTSYSLFHTADGGKTWTTVIANSTAGGGPAPGFPIDHSSGPENAGSKPGALYVVDPKVAFMGGQCMACDKPNTIGWTTDGGKTWTNGEAAFEGYGEQLLAIADANNGWWITTDSTAPSVMYTTADGGKSWKKVYTFETPKPGS